MDWVSYQIRVHTIWENVPFRLKKLSGTECEHGLKYNIYSSEKSYEPKLDSKAHEIICLINFFTCYFVVVVVVVPLFFMTVAVFSLELDSS